MESMKIAIRCLIVLTFLLNLTFTSSAQVNVIGSIEYEQVSHFEKDYFISAMKMSGDGLKIVFATSGPEVKVYTINSDGSALTQIYDFETTGFGPSVEASCSQSFRIRRDVHPHRQRYRSRGNAVRFPERACRRRTDRRSASADGDRPGLRPQFYRRRRGGDLASRRRVA